MPKLDGRDRSEKLFVKAEKSFLFEDVPAACRRADELYFAEVEQCDIYPGLFGNKYGYEDADVLTPTEREFDAATWLFLL